MKKNEKSFLPMFYVVKIEKIENDYFHYIDNVPTNSLHGLAAPIAFEHRPTGKLCCVVPCASVALP
ncbi:hypothetical protein [Brenneria goodwinii]|uniref:hypothetical protein n=1 Tax=Brenneria goodwinii TaxID=1109412 RepID=UPI0036F1857C